MSKYKDTYTHITPQFVSYNLLDDLKKIFTHKEFIFLLFYRDFHSAYKQTILGPLWFFIQPLVMSSIFTVVFGNIAKIPTDGTTPYLFYFAGFTVWNLFSALSQRFADIFNRNAPQLSKIYFPKICLIYADILIILLKFSIQFLVFIFFLLLFSFYGSPIVVNLKLLPYFFVIVMYTIIFAMGVGLIINSLTIKYKDLTFMISFLINAAIYATPIIYPYSLVQGKLKILITLNPMTFPIELFKSIFLNTPIPDLHLIMIDTLLCVIFFSLGYILFKKTEKDFIDTF